MPKIQAETANGLVETEAPAGKKLVLTLEDAGIDILHRCGGNARCTITSKSIAFRPCNSLWAITR